MSLYLWLMYCVSVILHPFKSPFSEVLYQHLCKIRVLKHKVHTHERIHDFFWYIKP